MSTEDQSRKTKKGRTEERRRKESGSLLVWVLRTGRSSMVEPARAYNYPATIAQSFFAPHKPHHHNKVASRRWGTGRGTRTLPAGAVAVKRPRPRPPPSSPAHLRGGKKKKKTQEAKLPKKFPRKGKSKAQKEQSLKGEKMYYTKRTLPKFPLSHRPKAQDTTCH